MIVVVVDECLKVADLDLLLAPVALHQGIKLEHHGIATVIHDLAALTVKESRCIH